MDKNWERVSYGKKKDKALTKHDKKRINENMLRVEDLDHATRSAVYLTGSEDLDLAAYAEANGANGNGGAAANYRSGNGDSPLKPRQQQQQSSASGGGGKSGDKSTGSLKRQPANNIEALQAISPSRLEQALERSRDTIPDSPLAWLIDICAIIDLDMVYDKKEEWNRTDLNFPSNHLPSASRQSLTRLLDSVSDDVKRRFYLHACQRLVKQSERQLGALGTRAVLQLCIRQLPQLPGHAACAQKMRELFDSARGTRSAFAALMWSLGQTAYKDRATGLLVLIDSALPADDGQLLATRWAAPDLLDTLDELTQDQSSLAGVSAYAKLTLRHAAGLLEAAASAGPGQTRDRLLRCLARLRPTWLRQASSGLTDSDACARLLVALRRWDTGSPPGSLLWKCLLDCLHAACDDLPEPRLLPNLPFSPEAASDLRLLRQALDVDEAEFGRPARLALAVRLQASGLASSKALPPDVARLIAVGAADAEAERVSAAAGRASRRRGGGGACGRFCGFAGRLLLGLIRLASVLLVVSMATVSVLCVLAFVPRAKMPAVVHPVQDYLEDRLVLYHVRRLHTDCRIQYEKRLAPHVAALWDRLADFYHDALLPKLRQAGQAWAEHAAPRLAAAWLAVSGAAASAWHYTEAQMRLYMPNVLTWLAQSVETGLERVAQLLQYLSTQAKQVYSAATAA